MSLKTALIAITLSLCVSVSHAVAFDLQSFDRVVDTVSDVASSLGTPQTKYAFGVKKFFNSFTSYQFPNPYPPAQDPLSRLEFPIDQWFLGTRFTYDSAHWSAYFDSYRSLNRDAAQMMQDSDWEDETQPFQKSVFSESKCKLNRGWLLDLGLNLHPDWAIFRQVSPVTGLRYQYFSFTTHDGYQVGIDGHNMELPGDSIDFEQTFYHLYIGGVTTATINTSGVWQSIPRMSLTCQLDYALATAKNEDLHLLRAGERITRDNTSGHCWHLNAALAMDVRNNMRAKFDVDFKRMITHGDHELSNSVYDIYFSFSGAKVWSDQFSLTGLMEFNF